MSNQYTIASPANANNLLPNGDYAVAGENMYPAWDIDDSEYELVSDGGYDGPLSVVQDVNSAMTWDSHVDAASVAEKLNLKFDDVDFVVVQVD